ncbi:ABC-type transport auxiliary lipoprotein family protein [Sphingomonas sp. 10B4]|uniref:ABC-type transport auxiliary lipoprotein family protein n=1 Tax=Sphingomonas sp. 10B4 TaxID=3048575 RepID=UPI002AB57001|nr:ABC-type transport auxiliary lipoprotein family protein [Sphingomonas sp. 10B4]MDY7523659.1 ABC-type transport auxiliary lipoprotein family protein [Sphingomonas sp. 10B4]MEB0283676.1 ABC-type transport auxiliary lipoprotein family protein [Sphingomonas sp. 10B4]
MTVRRSTVRVGGFAALCLLGGCVGGLLGGGKPDSLYRFGVSEPARTTERLSSAQPTLLVEKVRFASEIEGDRMLAVHAGTARYIKGVRWVTSAPGLFAQATVRELQSRMPGFRVTVAQEGVRNGYSLAVTIGQFEAQYDDASMIGSPTIVIAGDATLYELPTHAVVGQRHFVTRVNATHNGAGEIVAAFDRATTCYTADVADWIMTSAAGQPPSGGAACPTRS